MTAGVGKARPPRSFPTGLAKYLRPDVYKRQVLRQPVLHGGLDAVHADGVGVLVALLLEFQPLFGGGNRAHVAEHLRGQRAARVDALGAHGDLHARQRHRPGFDLDDCFIGHVLGDHDGLGVKEVHLHFGVDGHDLEHGFLIQHHVLDVRRRVGAGAVSYTHLDVYKRQRLCPRPTISPSLTITVPNGPPSPASMPA